MKTFIKVVTSFFLLLILLGAAGYFYLTGNYPKVSPAENIKIEYTPARLARGEYLVKHVVGCLGCHSQRDWDSFGGSLDEARIGMGGFHLDKKLMGLPGDLYAPNITPYHLKDWTDGELVRALRCGVNREGKALFPIMPYDDYSKLCQEDLFSIVAYIRTLKPVVFDPPQTRLDFPMNLIVRTIPMNAGPYRLPPDRKVPFQYNIYMINAADCLHCHTQVDDHGQPLVGMDFAGGMEFHWPDGSTVRSANITPDKDTGIGEWTRESFIKRFRDMKKMVGARKPVKPGELKTIMPWDEYGGMTDEDLGSIYDYLHTQIKPVKHQVVQFSAVSN